MTSPRSSSELHHCSGQRRARHLHRGGSHMKGRCFLFQRSGVLPAMAVPSKAGRAIRPVVAVTSLHHVWECTRAKQGPSAVASAD